MCRKRSLTLVAVVAALVLVIGPAAAALAADAPAQLAQEVVEQDDLDEGEEEENGDEQDENGSDSGLNWLAGGWLVFSFGVIVVLFVVINLDRKRVQDRATALVLAGNEIQTKPVEPMIGALETVEPPKELRVSGPTTIPVGSESKPFTAELCEPNAASGEKVEVTWSVDPGDAADLTPAAIGSEVKLVAAKPGCLELKATHEKTEATFSICAVVVKPAGLMLTMLGKGWASVTLGVVAAALVGVLGIIGNLDDGVMATLIAGLLGLAGYTVGQTSGQSGAGQDEGES